MLLKTRRLFTRPLNYQIFPGKHLSPCWEFGLYRCESSWSHLYRLVRRTPLVNHVCLSKICLKRRRFVSDEIFNGCVQFSNLRNNSRKQILSCKWLESVAYLGGGHALPPSLGTPEKNFDETYC